MNGTRGDYKQYSNAVEAIFVAEHDKLFFKQQNGYKWVQYVSFEHEIESRKSEYYQALQVCRAQRPNDITVWINFFLNVLHSIQMQLIKKLE